MWYLNMSVFSFVVLIRLLLMPEIHSFLSVKP